MTTLRLLRKRMLVAVALCLVWYLFNLFSPPWMSFAFARVTFYLGAGLIVLFLLVPANLRAELRLALVSVVVVIFYLVTKFEGGPFLRTEIVVLMAIWVVGQLIRAGLAVWLSSGTESSVARHIEQHGFISAISKAWRGGFGYPVARQVGAMLWAAAIMVGSVLVWQSRWLDERFDFVVHRTIVTNNLKNASHSVTITLTTPDNNPHKYLSTALELCRLLREKGAAVVSFPRRGNIDSSAQGLADSIVVAGGLTYPQADIRRIEWFAPNAPYIRYRPLDRSWRFGRPALYPGLTAAAKFLHAPVKVSPALLSERSLATYSGFIGEPHQLNEDVPHVNHDLLRIGDMAIPFWSDGTAAVPKYYWVYTYPANSGWDPNKFPADVEKVTWEAPLTYFDYASGTYGASLSDSVWSLLQGKMVFVQWVNRGEDVRRDDATTPALVADMIVRGLTVDQLGSWHLVLSCLIVLLGVLLARPGRNLVLMGVMAAVVVVLVVTESWLYSEHLIIGNLIYAAFTAALCMVVLPLVNSGGVQKQGAIDSRGM
jgi:hypothetical protein